MKKLLACFAGVFLLVAGCDSKKYSIVNVKDGEENRVFLLNNSTGSSWIWEEDAWRKATVGSGTKAAAAAEDSESAGFDKEKLVETMVRFSKLRAKSEELDKKLQKMFAESKGKTSREYWELVAERLAAEQEMDRIRSEASDAIMRYQDDRSTFFSGGSGSDGGFSLDMGQEF